MPFGKLQAGCHVALIEEWLPSGHSTIKARVTSALRVGKQVQGVSVLINKQNNKPETQTTHRYETESITPKERTKGSDRYREDNQ